MRACVSALLLLNGSADFAEILQGRRPHPWLGTRQNATLYLNWFGRNIRKTLKKRRKKSQLLGDQNFDIEFEVVPYVFGVADVKNNMHLDIGHKTNMNGGSGGLRSPAKKMPHTFLVNCKPTLFKQTRHE